MQIIQYRTARSELRERRAEARRDRRRRRAESTD